VRLFVVAAPGLEAAVAGEVRALGAQAVATSGGVELDGDLELLYRLNLWLRAATRVLVRLGEVRARDFARLRRDAAALPWETIVGPATLLELAVTAHRSRLHHTGAIEERLRGAIADRVGAAAATGPPQRVVVRGVEDRFLISVDSSGELLHRRGYRPGPGEAPLRETLAAGVLALAGWLPGEPLVDPTCGSGTLVIEAALAATGRAPGARRAFAYQRWPGYRADLHAALVAAAEAGVHRTAAPIHGSDVDPAAIEAAAGNAERAGVAADVRLVRAAVAEAGLPDGAPGLIVANPPYGRRLPALGAVYRDLGHLAASRPGWRLALLCPDPRLAGLAGRLARPIPLLNGGLRVGLYLSRAR
jgi:putative N6-adenine-specific DNA methylase